MTALNPEHQPVATAATASESDAAALEGCQEGRPTVAGIIVTFNRRETLRRSLAAVAAQERQPDRIVVVDNASSDGTADMVSTEFPEVRLLRMAGNAGFGAGLAAGMRWSHEQGFDYFWLLDDDSVPATGALAEALNAISSLPGIGIAGLSGGEWRWGPKHWRDRIPPERRLNPGSQVHLADFALIDGALVSRAAVDLVGVPRDDFFMMLEDLEFSRRVSRAGMHIVVLRPELISRGHLGSGGNMTSAPPWRGYYQTRNHLAMVLDSRSPAELSGWALRQAKFIAGTLLWGDRKLERIRMRMLGAAHGFQHRMGKTIDPA